VSLKTYSTGEAAGAAEISRATLQAWIASGKIRAPKMIRVGKVAVRVWAESDVTHLKQLKPTIYCKGRGRKKKEKAKK
jgi:excisionase family DNA binding protein